MWTASAYGHASDREFVPRFASFGALSSVLGDGYGNVATLEKLVAGAPHDYRENYSAGYALYVYLSTWIAEGAAPGSGREPLFAAPGHSERIPLLAGAPSLADAGPGDAGKRRFRRMTAMSGLPARPAAASGPPRRRWRGRCSRFSFPKAAVLGSRPP